MTDREQRLLEIAKEVINDNKDIGAKLTGSLMLSVMNIDKRREASDIDILCDELCEKGVGYPVVPKGFKNPIRKGFKSVVNAIQFVNDEGIKLEFMFSNEKSKVINSVACGELLGMIEAKKRYIREDKNIYSFLKHAKDLIYLFSNNSKLWDKD